MFGERMEMFRNRLVKVQRHLGRQARRKGIECYRVYDHDLPEFPLRIERYGKAVYLSEYKRQHGFTEEQHAIWVEQVMEVVAAVMQVSAEDIHWKLRQRKAGKQGQYQKLAAEKSYFKVGEGGLFFWVNLTDYLDTGLFLDHRITREMVLQAAGGKRVLNLFAYTGSFSVYAAAGGATEVCTVDLSKTYLDWSARNMHLNGFTGENYAYVSADVKAYLPTVAAGRYDLIILDPPTFSNSQRMEDVLDVQRDHVFLIRSCLRILTPGGKLFFSTNCRTFQLDAKAFSEATIKDLTRATTAFDFEGRLDRLCYLITRPD